MRELIGRSPRTAGFDSAASTWQTCQEPGCDVPVYAWGAKRCEAHHRAARRAHNRRSDARSRGNYDLHDDGTWVPVDGRVCDGCGYGMSRYNPNDRCHACIDRERKEDAARAAILAQAKADAMAALAGDREAPSLDIDFRPNRTSRTGQWSDEDLAAAVRAGVQAMGMVPGPRQWDDLRMGAPRGTLPTSDTIRERQGGESRSWPEALRRCGVKA